MALRHEIVLSAMEHPGDDLTGATGRKQERAFRDQGINRYT
jgi:hypothetical protein